MSSPRQFLRHGNGERSRRDRDLGHLGVLLYALDHEIMIIDEY
jgi:hypothetical protein